MSKHRPEPQRPTSPFSADERLESLLLGGVVALFVATLMIPSEAVATEGTHAALNMFWCLLLVAWGLRALLRPGVYLRIGLTGMAATALIGLHSLSAVVMSWGLNSRPALGVLWVWVSYGIGAFLLRQWVRTGTQVRAIIAVMISLGICLAMQGYFQFFVTQPAMRAAYERSPEAICQQNGINPDPGSIERQMFENRLRSVEPLATFALTNSLAGYLAPWLIAALGIAVSQWGRGGDWKTIVAGLFAASVIGCCLLLTKSRSGVLAALLGIGLLLLYGRWGGRQFGWKIHLMGAGVIVVIGLGVVFAGGLDSHVLSEAPKSLLFRLQYWNATAAMIADYPLFGCGAGNFQETYSQYKLPQASETIADPHNILFEIWATAGTPAILAFLVLLALLAYELWRSKKPPAAEQEPVTTSATFYYGILPIYVGALLGIVLGFAIGFLIGYPLVSDVSGGDIGILLLGLPMTGVFLWLAHNWVRNGRLPISLLVVTLVVLLVNLLVAGAMAFPGVAGTIWLLIPLALQTAGAEPLRQVSAKAVAFAGLLLSVALAILCYQTEYTPVFKSQSLLHQARRYYRQGQTPRAEELFQTAAQTDPWSAEPGRELVDFHFQQWVHTRQPESHSRFETAVARLSAMQPHSHRVFEHLGQLYLQAHAISGQPEHLQASLGAYRKAASLYPASSRAHAQLAWIWKLSDDESAAQMEAEEALRLDSLNPHMEQKLRSQHLFAPRWTQDRGLDRLQLEETAEQTMQNLRKPRGSDSG